MKVAVASRSTSIVGFSPSLWTVLDIADGARIDEISVSDDPPVYEAPPGYDEVVKFGFDTDIVSRKKRRAIGREPRSRTSPSRNCSMDVARSSNCSATATVSTSRGNEMASTQGTDATPVSKTPRSRCLPDSPPPPYVTPPGSLLRNFSAPNSTAMSSAGEREPDNDRAGEDAAAVRLRREWYRRGRQFSLSLPGNCDPSLVSSEGLVRVSQSVDADLLGGYLRNRDASSSFSTVDVPCDSQPRSLCAALSGTEPNFGDRGDGEATSDGPNQTVERVEETVVRRTVRKLEAGVVDSSTKMDTTPFVCSCEGACGCATVRRSPLIRERRELDVARFWPFRRVSVEQDDQETEKDESSERQAVEEQEEEPSRTKSTIVRLLGARAGRWQCGSGCSTTSSTPCGTLRRSPRKFTVCSRDSHIGRMSPIGSTASYEKLNNCDFDVAHNKLLHVSDPSLISSNAQRRRARRYSSCDLEGLYEGIRVLDGVLTRRGLAMTHGRKQSVTIMLFGTPDHGAMRRRTMADTEDTAHETVRVSRYSLDAISN